jgi:hypothetical protein
METLYMIILSVLYALAAIMLLRNRRMARGVVLTLVSPLVALSVLYALAIFMAIPHWAIAAGQSLYLLAIIVVSIFEIKDSRQ